MSRPILERFKMLRPLAKGGMGEVFLADDEATGERAVLKMMIRDEVEAAGASARFEHEIQILRRLNHPLIPRWLADGEWQGRRVVAVSHVDGLSLAELMTRLEQRLSATTALFLMIDTLHALHKAHSVVADDGMALGLVHRDVSPHNIVCDNRGRAHLIDFGVSVDKRFTDLSPGTLVGKIAYMAPEQASCFSVDARADQFAVGVVFWELLCGRRLFRGDSDQRTWKNVLACVVPDVSQFAEVPASIARAVARMLDPNRTRRFSSCAVAADALLSAAVDLPLGQVTPIATLQEAQSRKPVGMPTTTVVLDPLAAAAW
ncbi:MAG: serine/threonine-protein kinase [Deltaproteobacteria bacterium]|nr:serine/threonine-protein kinase [Deltaproteobacteria bacterium]